MSIRAFEFPKFKVLGRSDRSLELERFQMQLSKSCVSLGPGRLVAMHRAYGIQAAIQIVWCHILEDVAGHGPAQASHGADDGCDKYHDEPHTAPEQCEALAVLACGYSG